MDRAGATVGGRGLGEAVAVPVGAAVAEGGTAGEGWAVVVAAGVGMEALQPAAVTARSRTIQRVICSRVRTGSGFLPAEGIRLGQQHASQDDGAAQHLQWCKHFT